jgi:hypothetical protein
MAVTRSCSNGATRTPTRRSKRPGNEPNCKCSMRNSEHEVTCPAFDVDAAIDAQPGLAPDSVAQTTLDDDDDDEAEDDGSERIGSYTAIVDGKESVIDTRRPPLLEHKPTHEEIMDAIIRARDDLRARWSRRAARGGLGRTRAANAAVGI